MGELGQRRLDFVRDKAHRQLPRRITGVGLETLGLHSRQIADSESYVVAPPSIRRANYQCSAASRSIHTQITRNPRPGKKSSRLRRLCSDRCGFDSHHPLQSQPGPANDSEDGALATRLSRACPRSPALATASHSAAVAPGRTGHSRRPLEVPDTGRSGPRYSALMRGCFPAVPWNLMRRVSFYRASRGWQGWCRRAERSR